MSRAERTPFLGASDHDDDYETSDYRKTPANQYFKRALRIMSGITSLISIANFSLLIAAYVLIAIGPFTYSYSSADAVRDLSICLFTNFVLTTPSIFFTLPIVITLVFNFVMTIVVFVFTTKLFADGWSGSEFCRRYRPYDPENPYRGPLPETGECKDARLRVQIMMFVAGIVGLVVGIMLVVMTILRVVAVFKTKFWEGKTFPAFGSGVGGSGWNPNGFTVQFTLKVIRQEDAAAAQVSAVEAGSGSGPKPTVQAPEAERLIET